MAATTLQNAVVDIQVVSFVYFSVPGGNSKDRFGTRYTGEIETNIKLMPLIYPGWVMRIYVDINASNPLTEKLCHLSCRDETYRSVLDVCFVQTPIFSMLEN